MKKVKFLTNLFVFLLFLAVFIYSAYKIINFTGIFKKIAWGASCEQCLSCEQTDWFEEICQQLKEWCQRLCPPCPKPSPTPPEPTPTIPEPTPTVPEPTPTVPEPTPTPTPPPPGEPPAVGGPGEPYVCGAEVPSAPTLLSANRSGEDKVDLSWTAVSPVTHYSIFHGLSSRNYLYGVSNTGNVTSFIVGGLQAGADYCFAVRAVNDCAPSELSNEICTSAVLGVTTGKVLGVSALGATGGFNEQMGQILFIIGSICLSFGLRLFAPCLLAKKLA